MLETYTHKWSHKWGLDSYCPHCLGTGEKANAAITVLTLGIGYAFKDKCPRCNGKKRCRRCRGRGYIFVS